LFLLLQLQLSYLIVVDTVVTLSFLNFLGN
jgi:hypothetical protein